MSNRISKMPCSHTGKEPSPKGRGWCAHLMATGSIMRGRDGKLWQVKLDINKRKSWRRYTLSETKKRKLQKVVRAEVRGLIRDVKKYGTAEDFTQSELKRRGYLTLKEYLTRFPKRDHARST